MRFRSIIPFLLMFNMIYGLVLFMSCLYDPSGPVSFWNGGLCFFVADVQIWSVVVMYFLNFFGLLFLGFTNVKDMKKDKFSPEAHEWLKKKLKETEKLYDDKIKNKL